MSAIVESEFDRNLRSRERNRVHRKLALRRRSQQHPMVLFFVFVATMFAATALVPPTGVVVSPLGVFTAISTPAVAGSSGRVAISAGPSGSEIACHGQAWGAQSPECLAMIARDSGVAGRKIRVIAGA